MKKTVLHNKYGQYLVQMNGVSGVETFENGDVKFDVLIQEEWYAILLTSLSDEKMPCVFLLNPEEDRCSKPHEMHLKKSGLVYLCLSVREDVSVRNNSYIEILDYTILRVKKLLSMSENEEKREFRKEFLYYWNKASSNLNKINVFVSSSDKCKNITVWERGDKKALVGKDVSINRSYLEKYKKLEDKCIYIPLINSSDIMPPIEGKMWDSETLEYILNYCVSEENISLLEKEEHNNKVIDVLFEMRIPEIIPVLFLMRVNFSNGKKADLYSKLKDIKSIEYIESQMCSMDYLYKRIGLKQQNKVNNILMIGAGSLGSYVGVELPQIGINRMTIIDDDDFRYENLMRHRLGCIYSGIGKAFGLKYYMESFYPEVIIEEKKEKFKTKDLEKYNLHSYDLIIVATGGTDFMLSLNKKLKSLELMVPVLYTWIEAEGAGVHALLIDYRKRGCFQCLYNDSKKNKAHYIEKSKKIHLTGTGCGGVFNAYGNITLMKGSSMILEVVHQYAYDQLEIDYNPLFSIRTLSEKHPAIAIESRNFKTKKDFYISKECPICGEQI